MSKGKRREREAAELYSQAGYETFRPQESKFGETDIFGLFDVLAIGNGEVRVAQVKANQPRGYADWFERVRDRFAPAPLTPEYLICYDREGWRMIGLGGLDIEGVGPATFVDERDMDCAMGEGLKEYLQEAGNGRQ